jgi:hypothetical protein
MEPARRERRANTFRIDGGRNVEYEETVIRPAIAIVLVALGSGCSVRRPASPLLAGCADGTRLVCTGLYGPESGWRQKAVAPGIAGYDPAFHLWSDGLQKARYVYLPPGAQIDTRDMDEWVFPVGTKIWKQFSWQGHRIETRFLEKLGPDAWRMTTFAWNADESEAREELRGRTLTLPGTDRPYDIPSADDCGRCHGGRRDGVLGFEALALADATATGLTLDELARGGRLTRVPVPGVLALAGTPTERAALGWLHMNCGVSCHNPNISASACFTGLDLKLATNELAEPTRNPIVRTTLNKPTTMLGYRDPTAPLIRLVPGHPEQSALYVRARSRRTTLAMPPLATHVADADGLEILGRWITELGRASREAAK